MQRYEFKAVPAPTRAPRARGLKTGADRLAHAVTRVLNEAGAEGWEYLRTETLPLEERGWLTGRAITAQTLMIFRRARPEAAAPLPVAAPMEVPALAPNPVEAFEEPKREIRRPPGLATALERARGAAAGNAPDGRPAPHPGALGRAEPTAPARATGPLPTSPPASLEERRDALAGSLTPRQGPLGAPPRIGGARRD